MLGHHAYLRGQNLLHFSDKQFYFSGPIMPNISLHLKGSANSSLGRRSHFDKVNKICSLCFFYFCCALFLLLSVSKVIFFSLLLASNLLLLPFFFGCCSSSIKGAWKRQAFFNPLWFIFFPPLLISCKNNEEY